MSAQLPSDLGLLNCFRSGPYSYISDDTERALAIKADASSLAAKAISIEAKKVTDQAAADLNELEAYRAAKKAGVTELESRQASASVTTGSDEETTLLARLEEVRRLKAIRAEIAKEEAELAQLDSESTDPAGKVTKTISASDLTVSQAPAKAGTTNDNKTISNKVAGK